jgi:phosphohistidine phosphatase
MGRYLAGLDELPDLVLCSSALRARETVRLAAEAGGWSCPVKKMRELYQTTPEGILEVIRGCESSVDRVLLAGHEPNWSLLLGGLVGGATVKFPTAAMARVDVDVTSWSNVDFGGGSLIWLVTPKLLAGINWTG